MPIWCAPALRFACLIVVGLGLGACVAAHGEPAPSCTHPDAGPCVLKGASTPAPERAVAPQAPAVLQGFLPWAEGFSGALRFVIGDEVRITLPFYEDEDSTATVAPDGNIYLNLIGAVRANGRTAEDLDQELERRYAAFLRFPEVGVIPSAFASRQVFVGGEVANPGVYPLTGPTGVLEAIFQAGGFRDTARREHVVLIRRGPNNLPMMRFLDLKSFANEGTPTENTLLSAFDIIFVPKSNIAKINLFVQQYIEGVVPFNQNFNYTLVDARQN